MTRSLWLLALLALPLAGCSVDAAKLSPSDIAANQCDDSNPCVVGRCDHNICNGSGGTLTSLLVSVTTPETEPGVASLTYFKSYPADSTSALGSGGGALSLKLDPAVELSGTVSIDTTATCSPTFDGSKDMLGRIMPTGSGVIPIPADVSFTPTVRALGVSADSYQTTLARDTYTVHLTLPPGSYDVYITPRYRVVPSLDTGVPCVVPPRLLLNQSVLSNVDFKLPPPSTLAVDITWPVGSAIDEDALDPLARWTLDLVEPNSGRLLSAQSTLASPAPSDDLTTVTYHATLTYAPVYATEKGMLEPQGIGSELIRLKPPDFLADGSTPYTAPIFYAQLDGALVDPAGTTEAASIVQDKPLLTPVEVDFQTTLASGPIPVAAGVTITATELDDIDSLSTEFTRTVQVGTDGLAWVFLMPGRYRVNGLAKGGCTRDSCLSASAVEWVVRAGTSPQAGKLIEFAPGLQLSGQALVPTRDPAVGATVRAVASTAAFDSNVLNLGDGTSPVLPRASAGVVDGEGQFSFDADPGSFDFSVEPDPSTGFGWFVHPRLQVPEDSMSLNSVILDLPIVYRGAVTLESQSSSRSIPGALIRAYVFLKPDGTLTNNPGDGATAVQVAETQGEDSGSFALLIPPRLDGD